MCTVGSPVGALSLIETPARRWGIWDTGGEDEPPSLKDLIARVHRLGSQSEYQVLDDWYTVGLRSSARASIEAGSVLVQRHRVFRFGKMMETGKASGQAYNPEPIYRVPVMSALGLVVLPPSLGGASQWRSDFAVQPRRARRCSNSVRPNWCSHKRSCPNRWLRWKPSSGCCIATPTN